MCMHTAWRSTPQPPPPGFDPSRSIFEHRGRASEDLAPPEAGAGRAAQPPPFALAFSGQQAQALLGATTAVSSAPEAGVAALVGGGGAAAGAMPGDRPLDSLGNSSDTRHGSKAGGAGKTPCTASSSGSGASAPLQLPVLVSSSTLLPGGGLAAAPPLAMPTDASSAAAAPVAVKAEGGMAAGANRGSTAADGSVPRRVIANRQSAARSKERRRNYIIGLEQSVKNLTLQINEQQGHLHSLASNSARLCAFFLETDNVRP